MRRLYLVVLMAAGWVGPLSSQAHVHSADMHEAAPVPAPPQAGQAAFAAISQVVAQLMADSTTDWSRVDIEALRQHLIDMDNVVLHATVGATPIPGGVRLVVRGAGPVAASIRRMLVAHGAALDALPEYRARGVPSAGGATLEVTAEGADDEPAVTRIRALGFAGLLTVGDHHAMHHVMIARGGMPAGHQH